MKLPSSSQVPRRSARGTPRLRLVDEMIQVAFLQFGEPTVHREHQLGTVRQRTPSTLLAREEEGPNWRDNANSLGMGESPQTGKNKNHSPTPLPGRLPNGARCAVPVHGEGVRRPT